MVSAMGCLYAMTASSSMKAADRRKLAIASIRYNLITILSRDDAFKATLAHGSFAGASGGNFVVYSPDGTVYYDPVYVAPSSGLQNGFFDGPINGAAGCNSYGNLAAIPFCPIRADLSWRVICNACNPRLMQVDVSFSAYLNGGIQTTGNENRISLDKFKFSVIRPMAIP